VSVDVRPRVLLFSRSRPNGLLAHRAAELARRSAARLDVRVIAKGAVVPTDRPAQAAYVFDAVPAVLGPALRLRARGVPVVLEAGDHIAALERALARGRARTLRALALEELAWRTADRLVVRGAGFVDVLRERGVRRPVTVLPDGVDLELFRPLPRLGARARLGLADADIVVGVTGSIVWSPRHAIAYGWELVEALSETPSHVQAVVVGDGDGVPRLRARARELGVAHRLLTVPHVPLRTLPELLAAFDAVTWTQTPDSVGRARTTAKLPEYLACGKYVLASDVGEATRAIDGNGVRVPYRGGRDPAYVAGIAAAIRALAEDPARAEAGLTGRRTARRYDYDRVAAGFVGLLEDVLVGRRR
jgi:colanic acid biosynthesis glycosyl transferase WcaI